MLQGSTWTHRRVPTITVVCSTTYIVIPQVFQCCVKHVYLELLVSQEAIPPRQSNPIDSEMFPIKLSINIQVINLFIAFGPYRNVLDFKM